MEAHSFRLELGGRPTRNKTYAVYLTITVGGKRTKIKTPVEVDKRSDFNTKAINNKWVRKGVPNSVKMNDELTNIIENARNKYLELDRADDVSSNKVASSIRTKNVSESFMKFAEKKVQEILDAGRIRSWKKFNNFYNKLKKYQGKKDLLFSEINYDYLNSFKCHLEKLHNERNPTRRLHPNTVVEVIIQFKTLVNQAIKEGKMDVSKNPFLTFSAKGVKTQKEKLSANEIELIKALDLEVGSLIWHCRNYFLFSFYCAGIRAGDLIRLRWCNIVDNRLNYRMNKNHKVRDLVLVEPALEILSYYFESKPVINKRDYIFPLLDQHAAYAEYVDQKDIDTMPVDVKKVFFNDISAKNSLINKELRKIAKMAGIDKPLSMHISRHSFAKIAKDEGTDNSAIQQMLAHSSLKITEGYMGSFDTVATDNALRNIFKKKSNGKDTIINMIVPMLQLKDETYVRNLYNQLLKDSNESCHTLNGTWN